MKQCGSEESCGELLGAMDAIVAGAKSCCALEDLEEDHTLGLRCRLVG